MPLIAYPAPHRRYSCSILFASNSAGESHVITSRARARALNPYTFRNAARSHASKKGSPVNDPSATVFRLTDCPRAARLGVSAVRCRVVKTPRAPLRRRLSCVGADRVPVCRSRGFGGLRPVPHGHSRPAAAEAPAAPADLKQARRVRPEPSAAKSRHDAGLGYGLRRREKTAIVAEVP